MNDRANTPKRMLRVSEAAAFLGVSVAYLNNLRSRGGGPVYVTMGRAVAYHPEDLEKWLAERRRASTSDKGEAIDLGAVRAALLVGLFNREIAVGWIFRRRLDDDRRSYLRDAQAAWSKALMMCFGDLADFDLAAVSRLIAKGDEFALRGGFDAGARAGAFWEALKFALVNEARQLGGFDEELRTLEGVDDAAIAAGYVV